MRKETSQWSKDVRKAVIDKDLSLKQLAENIGYSYAVVSSVINGRYSNASYKAIAEKINRELGTTGLPERVDTPSDEWCQAVKIELVKRSMSVNQLAEKASVSRDRLSMVINGRMMNEQIVEKVNSLLDISLSAVPVCDS
ncbi:helix-turn-helix domain-containing protein [bacterium D16-51]|nr:helix-turn-helix domain-containing protein [bacterium D16-59]RKI53331.1 helix-turn-helix domain-containing protein [bacterium D16-51]